RMKSVLLFSLLLLLGLGLSQVLPTALGSLASPFDAMVHLVTLVLLAFIMIGVGYGFELDRTKLRSYGKDALIALSAAVIPWLLCAGYFAMVLAPASERGSSEAWRAAMVTGLFSAPTSAGVLFSMLAAAGLGATWMFHKARNLAIFDDLEVILLLIPLKILVEGFKPQLLLTVAVMLGLLWFGFSRMRTVRLSPTWMELLMAAGLIVTITELLYVASKWWDKSAPIHLEVLLPAFVYGCVLARPEGSDPHRNDALEGHIEGPEDPDSQRAALVISGLFMVCVGLSMPPLQDTLAPGQVWPGWGVIALHTAIVTVLMNLGKMLPALCYRKEASPRERLALAIALWPRGEVGAGVIVLALGYGISGLAVTVALLSLTANLLLTGVFIAAVRYLLAGSVPATSPRDSATINA
ncbi:MAG: sodium:proton antiporter, partial [Verrucomicrobiaceae bacterium]